MPQSEELPLLCKLKGLEFSAIAIIRNWPLNQWQHLRSKAMQAAWSRLLEISILHLKVALPQCCVSVSNLMLPFKKNKNTQMIKAVIPSSSQFEMCSVDLYVSLFILWYTYYHIGTSPMMYNAYCMLHELMTQVLKPKWPILFVHTQRLLVYIRIYKTPF